MAGPRDPCAGCVYQTLAGGHLICYYIVITGHCRPCKFGAGKFGVGCTVKQTEGGPMMKNWDKATALQLWKEGKCDPEIAEAVGVSAQTIKVWLKREGLRSNYDPATARKRKATAEESPTEPEAEPVDAPDGDGQERTEPDGSGPEDARPAHVIAASGGSDRSGSLTAAPVELHLELSGGWARLRAPSWEQAAKLWRMLEVCVEALRADGGA